MFCLAFACGSSGFGEAAAAAATAAVQHAAADSTVRAGQGYDRQAGAVGCEIRAT